MKLNFIFIGVFLSNFLRHSTYGNEKWVLTILGNCFIGFYIDFDVLNQGVME